MALCETVFFIYDQVTNAGLKAKKSFLKGAQMTTKYIRKTVIVDTDLSLSAKYRLLNGLLSEGEV